MKYNKKYLFWSGLVLLALLLKWFGADASRVENTYATGFYVKLAQFLRFLFGWLPFSIGDILYGGLVLWLIFKLIRGIRLLVQKKATWKGSARRFGKAVVLLLLLYVVFNGFWGINYNRQGIAHQLKMDVPDSAVSYNDLKQTTALLIEKLNTTKQYLIRTNLAYPNNRQLFKKVAAAYESTQKQFPFLSYKNMSLKPSLWGWLGNYTGFTGYYNPFTGEAQVNTTVPKFLQPFIACHEAAHQLGYAKENEANSVGFIAALHSGDSLLLYSAYFDMFNYASRQLFIEALNQGDTLLIKDYKGRLSPEVRADFKEMAIFFQRHRNPIEPIIRSGYAFYLKNNNQPLGIRSYDAVTAFLVAYYKKFGSI